MFENSPFSTIFFRNLALPNFLKNLDKVTILEISILVKEIKKI